MADKKKKLTWEEYEKKISNSRTKPKLSNKKGSKAAPSSLMVQRMSSQPTGRLKKYEPLDTREFVDFTNYDEVTIDNIKTACESHYNAPAGSCDVLLSDRGPSCYLTEQITNKKVYFVRFISPDENKNTREAVDPLFEEVEDYKKSREVEDNSPSKKRFKATSLDSFSLPPVPSSAFPKSVSIGDLLKARKLVRPPDETVLNLVLEKFDVLNQKWVKLDGKKFTKENTRFAEGGFRVAFRATSDKHTQWVIKVYKEEQVQVIEEVLKLSVEEHTRKQVQMHAVAKEMAMKMARKAPEDFGPKFQYHTIYYAQDNGVHMTVEKYIPGVFQKYVNNNGLIGKASKDYEEVYQKAECLCHFSYVESKNELMVLDLQGCMYELFDPEIASSVLQDSEGCEETNFCAGNLSTIAIDAFFCGHKCNKFCNMLNMPATNKSLES